MTANVDQSLAKMTALSSFDESSPAGTWVERFSVDGVEKTGTLHFTPNGRVFIIAGPPHGGAGAGSWRATGEGTFSYRIAERILGPGGEFIGWVDIDHEAVQDGDSFSSTGVSRVYDAEDRLVTTVAMRADGTRVRLEGGSTTAS
ncbi:class I SAM-dependent methyltransferase [Lentzea nigeriaca]|uniref:hypothetical protein n=1 Tax=Lentzea nigeriaca TaxID=1128665 RepID=UPI00195E7ED2|nr:hypothetical protein [Lentzea nigeriaca]MBM7862194.1 hypothetical protein [Lentzea nigeriaca]